MDISNFTELSDVQEALTPLNFHRNQDRKVFNDNSDDESSTIAKIPHGLTAKRNRRKSLQHTFSNNTKASGSSPLRVPLTVPRPNALNSQPLNFEATKRSLLDQLSNISGKENSIAVLRGNDFKSSIPSSDPAISKKRLSSVALDGENEALPGISESYKLPKLNLSFNKSDGDLSENASFIENHQSGVEEKEDEEENDKGKDLENREEESEIEEEEFSRIEPFSHRRLSGTFSIDQSAIQENQETPVIQETAINREEARNGKYLDESTDDFVPLTPSRFTEPVALSPKTEQDSRIINDSKLLLDTTRSVAADDSYLIESPIPTTKAELDDDFDILQDLTTLEGFSPQKRLTRATPNQRPFFTIAQVHEIQEDFKREAENLGNSLKEKSILIVQLNEEISRNKTSIYQLQEKIESLSLQNKQLSKENELMESEREIFKNDITDLDGTIKDQNEKLVRQKTVIAKFRDRLLELSTQQKSKERECEELTETITSQKRAIDILQSRVTDFEIHAQKLKFSLEQESKQTSELTSKIAEYEADKVQLESQIFTKEEAIKVLEVEKKGAIEQLNSNSTEALELNCKVSDLINSLNHLNQEKDALSEENGILINKLEDLKKQFEGEGGRFESRSSELEALLTKSDANGQLKEVIIQGLKKGISTLHNSISDLNNEVLSQSSLCQNLEMQLSESNESLIIRKAEVDELNNELKASKFEIERVKSLVLEKEGIISQLSSTLNDNIRIVKDHEDSVRKVHEEINKIESEHIGELESLHSELSNLQSIIQTKSNEILTLKEEKSKASSEMELLKYELDESMTESKSYKDKISAYQTELAESKSVADEYRQYIQKLQTDNSGLEKETEKRLQQLAEDLYIQYSKKHEQKVAVLKKGFENKWQSKLSKSENESEKLRREIEGLKTQLEKESAEKKHVIQLWDNYIDEQNKQKDK
ncbi:hypothetical protein WICMUC_005894 [Wickerhamomyces mucosus]|uniref:Uncharacterized protein n=1 Tax=Wickerhamomyces mucosus TaxID=1378264 RepID=A0A9P8T377_9ASCO|nr:hypothetical protein WICMUC_005894 [Wickerhamomyces mucosus]